MTDEAINPLRRRTIEDMTIRKLSPKTQQGYIRTIKDLAAFLGRPPDTASFEDIRRFQLHLAAKGAHVPILNHTVAALRFFFRVTGLFSKGLSWQNYRSRSRRGSSW
jgi:integrase/recombinase XerD